MSLSTNQYAVNNTATLVCDQSASGARVTIHNIDQGNAIYVGGGSTVSSVTGFRLDAKDKFQFDLNPSEQLWAICAPNQTATLAVVRQTQYA